jgi:hypothetical protein
MMMSPDGGRANLFSQVEILGVSVELLIESLNTILPRPRRSGGRQRELRRDRQQPLQRKLL